MSAMIQGAGAFALRFTRSILKGLLRAYPTAFRTRCGPAMLDLYSERFRELVAHEGLLAGMGLFARTGVNFVGTGIAERATAFRSSTESVSPSMVPAPGARSRRHVRVQWTIHNPLRGLAHGVRFFVRELRSAPAITTAALLSLSLGIGATTAVFGLVRAVLLKPLPFADEDRLVRIYQIPDDRATRISLIPITYDQIDRHQSVFSSMVAQQFSDATLDRTDGAQRIVLISVTRDWLKTLGVQPSWGRGFTPEEAELGEDAAVAVISHRLWQREFAGARSALGSAITINQKNRTIVGVMPPHFSYPYHADVWVPMRVDPATRGTWGLNVQGRLAPGVSLSEATAELEVIGTRLAVEYPARHRGATLTPIPLRATLVQDNERLLLALLGAVVFVLLIVCANLANLFLARGLDRQRQFALRAALGASRGRLVTETFSENLTVALFGGLAGLVFAVWAVRSLTPLIPGALSYVLTTVPIDTTALGFCGVVTVATAVLFGVMPAWRASGIDPARTLQSATRSITGGRTLSADALVAAEVALAFMLLAAAGLMVQSFKALQGRELGYSSTDLWLITAAVDREDYAVADRRVTYVTAVEAALRQLPGVERAGTTSMFPWDRANTLARIEVDGRDFDADERLLVNHRSVTPGFLEAIGVPLVRGRYADSRDRMDAAPVVVVSEATADRLWPGQDPVGRRVREVRSVGEPGPWKTVVGVVSDVLEYDEEPMTWYVPYEQSASAPTAANLIFAVRARGKQVTAERLRDAVASVDPTLAVDEVIPASRLQAESVAGERFAANLLAAFSLGGLLMAAIGIYGVLAHAVSRRVPEIGVRLALGATPGRILRDVMAHGLILIALGLSIGIAGALATTRLVRSTVPEFGTLDPGAVTAAAGLLAAVAMLASYIPARRAMQADPASVLNAG